MFRCDVCARVTPPNTPCNRIAVETREVEYPVRKAAHWHPPRAGGKGKWVDDPGGHGIAIVREVRACAICAAKMSALDRESQR